MEEENPRRKNCHHKAKKWQEEKKIVHTNQSKLTCFAPISSEIQVSDMLVSIVTPDPLLIRS